MAETVKKATTKVPAKPRKASSTKAAGNGAPNNVPSNVTEIRFAHDQVAQLAHRYWAERGQKDGHHLEDWFRAEQELRAKAS
jgi:hypothetical protein